MIDNKLSLVLLDLSLTDPKVIEEASNGDDESFLCFLCKTKITDKKYIISVTNGTPYRTFTNPYGFSYNVMTVSYCEMVKEASEPIAEHTWFHGYAWSILTCMGCSEHLGWRFKSISEKLPASFYCLIRDKLVLSV